METRTTFSLTKFLELFTSTNFVLFVKNRENFNKFQAINREGTSFPKKLNIDHALSAEEKKQQQIMQHILPKGHSVAFPSKKFYYQ